MTKNIYNLKLHESIFIDDKSSIEVMRVPGGWIYTFIQWYYSIDDEKNRHSVFVPFDNSFIKEANND